MLKTKIVQKIYTKLFNKQNNSKQITSAGILYICTGKYEIFFDKFFTSFNHLFLPSCKKKYFVFTDSKRLKNKYDNYKNILFFDIQHLGWPLGTLLRNEIFNNHFDLFKGLDYLFFCNANLVCKQQIHLNDLGLSNGYDLCGVQHPNFFHRSPHTFELEKTKPCYALFSPVEIDALKYYFQGCFYGGKNEAFHDLVKEIYRWTKEDLSKDIMPIWLDESYLNRYFFLNPPYAIHPGFAYPEKKLIPFPKMIVQLDKTSRDKVFKRD